MQSDLLGDGDRILIAADVPIGIPAEPSDVYTDLDTPTFLGWLNSIADRCHDSAWRDQVIAKGVANRSASVPFVSLGKGEKRGGWDGKRQCDRLRVRKVFIASTMAQSKSVRRRCSFGGT